MQINTSGDRVKQALERVERALQTNYSKQSRLNSADPNSFFSSILRWVSTEADEEPPYSSDTRRRDKWLQNVWRKEAHLAGVLGSVTSIDQNRAWTMTGGRNQVRRYLEILRHAEDGAGWRAYIQMQSLAYYTSDLGAVTETGRDGKEGPLRALYHVDPAVCYLTGDRRGPLIVEDQKKPWGPEDFFRLTSMRSTSQDMHGAGWCSVSRIFELTRIMMAVYSHELEQLGARAPKGLLLLQNISQDQWEQAMRVREASLDGEMRKYYNAVAVIAQEGVDSVDAKLVALSQLPDGFNIDVFTNLLMYAYALAFGYDPIEFWPVQAGQLGRGRETDIQHRKGTGKGGLNFMLAHQDQLQMQFPDTLLFEYEQRDQEGILLEAKVLQAWTDVAKALYEKGEGVLDRDQVQSLLVERGVIPSDWTVREEDVSATDSTSKEIARSLWDRKQVEKVQKEKMLEIDHVRRAAETFPREPIVRYRWPTAKYEVIWKSGEEALSADNFSILKPEFATLPERRSREEPKITYIPLLSTPFPADLGRLQSLWSEERPEGHFEKNGHAVS